MTELVQPFRLSMERSKWYPREAIRPRISKRPLGRLEWDSRFTPRQPVLSSRTLNIDKSGSRTYRAKSTSAIIEEQHQLLHDVYLSNRRKAASSAKTQTVPGGQQQVDHKRRRFLTINGTSTQRPWTSVERPKPFKEANNKKRPRTTTSRVGRETRPATDTYLRMEEDQSLQASTNALHRAQQQVRDLWRPDQHRQELGRGGRAGELPGPDTRSGTWLNFSAGGGDCDDDEAGLVQAFTAAMRDRGDEYYTIDENAGTHVARQLRRGDKVRVGINGNVQSTTLRVKRWGKEAQQEEFPYQDNPPASMPLCWADQVMQSDAKVLQPRLSTKTPPKKNLCESRPVIFEHPLSEDPLGRHDTMLRSASGTGFAVRTRTRHILGIDGSTTQPITNVTIGTNALVDEDADAMSVDDILERQRHGCEQEHQKWPGRAIPNLTDLRTHNAKFQSSGWQFSTPPCSVRSVKAEVASPPPNRAASGLPWSVSGGDGRSVRPLTAHSAHSIDHNFDSFVVTASKSTSGKAGSANPWPGGRATSGKRPLPAKPTLHRSVAAQGVSISTHGNKGDTSYIKITQSLVTQQAPEVVQTEQRQTPQSIPASLDSMSMDNASLLDQDLSQADFSELESDMEDTPIGDDNPFQHESDDDGDGIGEMQVVDQLSSRSPQHQAVESFSLESDHTQHNTDMRPYAFNIPTASEVDDDECEEEVLVRQTLHDRLVEQTADLLAGAIIGADLMTSARLQTNSQ